MKVAVIIVNHRSEAYLYRCIESLYAQSKVQLEIIVVENEGKPLSFLSKRFPQVTVLPNRSPKGFAANVNRGLMQAESDFFLLLNPDTELHNDVPGILALFLKEHPKVGIVGPQICNRDGTLQLSCRSLPTFAAALARRTPLRWFPPTASSLSRYLLINVPKDKPFKVDWVSGAAMAFSRALLDQIGFLDEQYTMYLEDVDFCLRAQKRGWQIFYEPQAELTHFGQISTGQRPYRNILRHHKSMLYYVKKHRIVPSFLYPFCTAAAVMRCVYALLFHAYGKLKALF